MHRAATEVEATKEGREWEVVRTSGIVIDGRVASSVPWPRTGTRRAYRYLCFRRSTAPVPRRDYFRAPAALQPLRRHSPQPTYRLVLSLTVALLGTVGEYEEPSCSTVPEFSATLLANE